MKQLSEIRNAAVARGCFVVELACPSLHYFHLEDGAPVGQFVEWFPGVTLAQVRAVLEYAARSALIPA